MSRKLFLTRNYQAIMQSLLLLFIVFYALMPLSIHAQDYPFADLPNEISAVLNVNTTKKENFKNQLLGYNVEGFNTAAQKDFIRKFDPVSIRFPHGVWANFYEWQTDGYQQDSYDNKDHQVTLDTYVNTHKGHINNIATLNKEREKENEYGFNMMWTYSINFDDAASCVARANKDLALGLEVKDIEFGNEHFWKNQRCNRTVTAEDYLKHAKSVAKALHNEFPEVRLSIPLGWRRDQAGYNKTIADDKKYFDAISVHKYLGADPDIPGESDNAYSSLLTARLTLHDDITWVRNNYGPDKSIWLTVCPSCRFDSRTLSMYNSFSSWSGHWLRESSY